MAEPSEIYRVLQEISQAHASSELYFDQENALYDL